MASAQIKLWALGLLLLVAVGVTSYTWRASSDRQHARATIEAIAALSAQREDALRRLSVQPFAEPGVGVVDSYLAKIRRDGVGKHSDFKRRLDEIGANTIAIGALIDVYEPNSKTARFRAEAKKFRAYALVWTDRWNGVFETFMLGGRLPANDPLYPDGFSEALQSEIDAVK